MPWMMKIMMALHGLKLRYKWKKYSSFPAISYSLTFIDDICRTDVVDRVRRLNDDPREEERTQVENLRQQLTSHFAILSSIERRLNILPGPVAAFDDGLQATDFDDIDQEHAPATNSEPVEPAMAAPPQEPDPNLPLCPEARTIQFPSNT